jgi:hypothetical protein
MSTTVKQQRKVAMPGLTYCCTFACERPIMSDVFISWGDAADRATVGELTFRLINSGLSIFEYTRSMDPGDLIDNRVMQEINTAKTAILRISDTSISREWVLNEIAWLHQARQRIDGLLRAIISVQTGALDAHSIPQLLANTSVYHFEANAANSREALLDDLIRAIFKNVGKQTPVPFPGLILAVNAVQFTTLAQLNVRRITKGETGRGQVFL